MTVSDTHNRMDKQQLRVFVCKYLDVFDAETVQDIYMHLQHKKYVVVVVNILHVLYYNCMLLMLIYYMYCIIIIVCY